MRLIDLDKLIKDMHCQIDDLNDIGQSKDASALCIALHVIDRQPPVIAITLEDIMRIMEDTKKEICDRSVRQFVNSLEWQVKHEKDMRGDER